MSIYQKLLAAGVPTDHYESDLYARATPEAYDIMKHYEFRDQCTLFFDSIDHEVWIDIPFAYDPFWVKGAK